MFLKLKSPKGCFSFYQVEQYFFGYLYRYAIVWKTPKPCMYKQAYCQELYANSLSLQYWFIPHVVEPIRYSGEE